MDLSIVIPAYNEEKRLGGSLSKIIPYLDSLELNYEIIVVDDGSKDKTIEVANQFKDKTNLRVLENKINRGKGYSVKQGILDAKFDHVLFTDSDLATPIDELDILLEGLKEDNDIEEYNTLEQEEWDFYEGYTSCINCGKSNEVRIIMIESKRVFCYNVCLNNGNDGYDDDDYDDYDELDDYDRKLGLSVSCR